MLRILIADDHAAMRITIRALIESRSQWIVCAEAADGEEAVDQTVLLVPDVAVLDLQMPKLNGLEAARRIRERAPTVQILLLTMHDSNGLYDQARRAGARDVIIKSDASGLLLDAIESLQAPKMAVALAGAVVRDQRHIGAFFHSEEERYQVLGPFIADGLACGEKAVHIIDSRSRERHVQQLMHVGIDAAAAEARHQLDLRLWEETYLRGDHFDQLGMTDVIRQLLGLGKAEGYPLTRAIAYMEWALGGQPGVSDLIEHESRLNDTLAHSPDVVICAYDLTKFAGHVIVDVLRCHPVVIVARRLREENPFYTPPAEMIRELRRETAARPITL
jgi:DNA-binding NarL/FixJ family response regulator